jgi:pyrrolidone-carboxylate peptidase
MGDITPDTPLEGITDGHHDHREIKVLVTGYAPFHNRFPINSSWSIASTLPESLPATPTCPRIKITVPSEPIKVAYRSVMEWQEKWLKQHDYDLILHIGLAAGRKFFTMERQSFRDGYWEKPDVLGEVFSKEMTDKVWPQTLFPPVLKPTLDCSDLWLRWRNNVRGDLDVRPSDDPGNYLCGFIYYCSMARYWALGSSQERPVMFLHVPDLPTDELVAGGREVAVGLIRAMVQSRVKVGVFDPFKEEHVSAVKGVDLPVVVDKQPLRKTSDAENEPSGEDDMAWTYRR